MRLLVMTIIILLVMIILFMVSTSTMYVSHLNNKHIVTVYRNDTYILHVLTVHVVYMY